MVLEKMNTAHEFVYRAVGKSYVISPTLARPRAGREKEVGSITVGIRG